MTALNIIRAMEAAGCDEGQILKAVRAYEQERLAVEAAAAEERRIKDRDRKREERAREKAMLSEMSTGQPGRAGQLGQPDAHIEHASTPGGDNPSTVESSGEKTKTTPSVCQKAKPTPRSELETVLDAEHADAVLEHRQRIRSPLTARAAKLLAGKLAEWPGGANEAADAMIEAGWRGFEPEWLENRRVPQNSRAPPGRHKSMSEQLSELADRPIDEVFQ